MENVEISKPRIRVGWEVTGSIVYNPNNDGIVSGLKKKGRPVVFREELGAGYIKADILSLVKK